MSRTRTGTAPEISGGARVTSHEDIPVDGWAHYTTVAPWADNPNIHPEFQPEQIAESIRAFGFVAPAVIWPAQNRLVAGHGRLQAMRLLVETGYDFIDAKGEIQHRDPEPDFTPIGAPGPGMMRVVFHDFPSESAANAYALADNEIAKAARWDEDKVKELVKGLKNDDTFDALHAIGFPHEKLSAMVAENTGGTGAFLGAFLGTDNQNAGAGAGSSTEPSSGAGSSTEPGTAGGPAVLVDFVVPMSVPERAEIHGIVNTAKRITGVTSTREAVLAIFKAYEAGVAGKGA